MQVVITEKQRFRQIWLWVLIAGINLIPLIGLVYELLQQGTRGGMAPDYSGWLTALSLTALTPLLFLLLRLDTTFDASGIYYRFAPFQRKARFIPWTDVSHAYIRTYRPIAEYGGWGIRVGLRGGQAYNVSGNIGLQLILKDKSEILLGTQQPDAINALLRELNIPGAPATV